MLIDKVAIRHLIPHAGTMCLIDSVSAWDVSRIVCASNSHRHTDHPLRRDGVLAALHAFEYGAQAAAIHGGLLAARAGRPIPRAWLGSLRDARLDSDRLDTIIAPLEIGAELLLSEDGNAIYRCRVAADGKPIAEARVTIMRRH
jgi:predicted hotdog family 3-hydroxylacyl-ACP dehydratase